jgi:hypothetical protein
MFISHLLQNDQGRQDTMSNEAVNAPTRARKPKARKFYKMEQDFRASSAPGYRIENETRLLFGRRILGPGPEQRGFPIYPEAPRILFDKKLGRPVRDLEQCSDYWLISDRMKAVLEATDAEGFAFVKCEVRLRDGEPGPDYWLCDVVRVLDAVDEMASRLKIYDEAGEKTYSLRGGANLVFKEDVVGSAHVFRMAHLEAAVICDEQIKDACRAAHLRGVALIDTELR